AVLVGYITHLLRDMAPFRSAMAVACAGTAMETAPVRCSRRCYSLTPRITHQCDLPHSQQHVLQPPLHAAPRLSPIALHTEKGTVQHVRRSPVACCNIQSSCRDGWLVFSYPLFLAQMLLRGCTHQRVMVLCLREPHTLILRQPETI